MTLTLERPDTRPFKKELCVSYELVWMPVTTRIWIDLQMT